MAPMQRCQLFVLFLQPWGKCSICKTKIVALLALMLFAVQLHGQSRRLYRYQHVVSHKKYRSEPLCGFSFLMDRTQGQLANLGYNSSWGFGAEYFSRYLNDHYKKKVSVRIGVRYLYSIHGQQKYDVLLHSPYMAPATEKLYNKRSELDLQLVLMYEKGTVRPYIDFFGGYSFFNSQQRLTLNESVKGYEKEANHYHWTNTPDFGMSIGCLVQLQQRTFFHVRASAIYFINPVEFINFTNLSNDGFTYTPNYVEAQSIMYTLQAGFLFSIPKATRSSSSSNGSHSHYHGGFHGGGCGGGAAIF
jgi:hypothetical protein